MKTMVGYNLFTPDALSRSEDTCCPSKSITPDNPIKGNRIKCAGGSWCELYSSKEMLSNLVVRTIIEVEGEGQPPGFIEPFLLVFYYRCQDAMYAFDAPPDEQKKLARQR